MSPQLAAQIAALDEAELAAAIEQCIVNKGVVELPTDYVPAPYLPLTPENPAQAAEYEAAFAHGEALVRAGKVAAFTVAGGQGTRLGYDGPKGTLPVSPVREKTLFELFAEQIAGFAKKYDTTIPWYIMCSPLNLDATRDYFETNDFLGLSRKNVSFFAQGTMPATDFEGNLLLATPDSLALSPNGHGGSLKALIDSGAIADMAVRGVEHLAYFQVDNPLVSVIDPLFIGLHHRQNSDMSSRSLTKTNPFEKLGNLVLADGRLTVIEYSDFPDERALEKEDDGRIRYRAGSPAIHLLRRDFVERFADGDIQLPWHRAEKKVPCVDDPSPKSPNAVKFETFVFDALPLARNPLILEGDRAETFSPVKNPTGVDSLESCQRDLVARARRWLGAAGLEPPEDSLVEISPAHFPSAGDLKGASLTADGIYQSADSRAR